MTGIHQFLLLSRAGGVNLCFSELEMDAELTFTHILSVFCGCVVEMIRRCVCWSAIWCMVLTSTGQNCAYNSSTERWFYYCNCELSATKAARMVMIWRRTCLIFATGSSWHTPVLVRKRVGCHRCSLRPLGQACRNLVHMFTCTASTHTRSKNILSN